MSRIGVCTGREATTARSASKRTPRASPRTGRSRPTAKAGRWNGGELGAREAARILGVCERTVISRTASGKLPAWQVCKGARWVIKADDLSRERDPALPSLFDVRSDDASAQKGGRRP